MRIVVTVRTRDEEHRIGKFCEAYKDANLILVGDGGSVDNTVEIAKLYKNVLVRKFQGRTEMKEGHWRNNDSYHANWMFEWAKFFSPDWIIYDDCDCVPNFKLKQDYRKILEETKSDVVMAVRFYMWGLDQHFPYLAKPEKNHEIYEPSLWAWRGSMDLWTIDVPPAYTFRIGEMKVKDFHHDANTLDLFPPYCLIHSSWDNEERVKEKVKLYRESGLIPNMSHPLHFGGPLEPLPDFVHV